MMAQPTKREQDCILKFRDDVERILLQAGVEGWETRFEAKNAIVDCAIAYGVVFAKECLEKV